MQECGFDSILGSLSKKPREKKKFRKLDEETPIKLSALIKLFINQLICIKSWPGTCHSKVNGHDASDYRAT